MHPDYFNHFDPAKNFEKTCFLASGSKERPLQSAELNETEDRQIYNRTTLADSFLQNGDLISGVPLVSNGKIKIPECRIYADGAVRIVGPVEFNADTNKTIGLKRVETLVMIEDDSGLGDPVTRSENSGMEGAARLKAVYKFTETGFAFPFLSYQHSGKRLFSRGIQNLASLSLASEADIVVADSLGCPDLHQALHRAAPGSRILVKCDQTAYIPYKIETDDLTIQIAPGVTIEGSKFLGIRSGVPDSDERKRAIFDCRAQRTLIRGGRIGIERHDQIGSQFLAVVSEGSSAMFRDYFYFDGIPGPKGQGLYNSVGNLPDIRE